MPVIGYYCQALSISQSLNLSLSLRDRDDTLIRGTIVTKAPLRVQLSPALGGRGWERVKAKASPRLY